MGNTLIVYVVFNDLLHGDMFRGNSFSLVVLTANTTSSDKFWVHPKYQILHSWISYLFSGRWYMYICQCFFHHCWRFMDLAWLSKTVFRATLSVKFTTIILSKCFPWIILHVSPFPSSENWNIIHLLTLSIN